MEFFKAPIKQVHLSLKLLVTPLQKVIVYFDLLEKVLRGWCNCIPLLIALVFFTCLVDTGVTTGRENTDGFLDGRL